MRFFPPPSSWRPGLAALLAWSGGVLAGRAQSPAATPPPMVPDGKFPIAVWLQSPNNAPRYHAAGINLYVGLSDELSAASLDALAKSDMKLITEQTPAALAFRSSPVITGWMHGDEPDNARRLPQEQGGGYGPPVPPEPVIAEYRRMKAADPVRPVLLNLSMAVAWDGWFGRGTRTNHPEDYPKYVQGADIASFDIYPVTFANPTVGGKLEYVAQGVQRLVQWAGPERTVWDCIECTHISNPTTKPIPAQVRAEVWMSLIRGSRGLIYFCHQFAPTFREPGLLDDPEMVAAITAINAQIQLLAPALNAPTVSGVAFAASEEAAGHPAGPPVAILAKRSGGSLYLFAANLTNSPCKGTLSFKGMASGQAEVLGEDRLVPAVSGDDQTFIDDSFEPYGVHLYRLDHR